MGGNPKGFFDKNFDDYKAGFESRGELWLGLESLHKLTSERNYKLRINLKDFDNKVGPGDGYKLAINRFNSALSTLGDSFTVTVPTDPKGTETRIYLKEEIAPKSTEVDGGTITASVSA